MTSGPDLMLSSEVAELLRIPAATLRYWRSIGEGPESFKIGAGVRYERAKVLAYLDAQKAATVRGGAA